MNESGGENDYPGELEYDAGWNEGIAEEEGYKRIEETVKSYYKDNVIDESAGEHGGFDEVFGQYQRRGEELWKEGWERGFAEEVEAGEAEERGESADKPTVSATGKRKGGGEGEGREKPAKREEQEVTASVRGAARRLGYKLVHTIGSGQYTTVKLALSRKDDTPVAIRILDKRTIPKQILEKFVRREMSTVLQLVHPNVIRHWKFFETENRIYTVMEYAGRRSLLDVILKEGPVGYSRSRYWFEQLVKALQYCHNNGVAHRDVKCESLLLDHNLRLKLGDFQFSRQVPCGLLDSTFCGSLAYAAPELLRGLPYCPALVDVWAAGVVLFAMSYGRLPFDHSDYGKLLKQVQSPVLLPKEPQIPVECKTLLGWIFAPAVERISLGQIRRTAWLTRPPKPFKDSSSSLTINTWDFRTPPRHLESQRSLRPELDEGFF